LNLLALFGWNAGDEQEVFSIEELTQRFDLSRIQKSGAKFDPQKALWLQNYYFQRRSTEVLTKEFSSWLKNHHITVSESQIKRIVPLIKERVSFVPDLWAASHFFFQSPSHYDEAGVSRVVKENTCAIIEDLIPILNQQSWDNEEALSEKVKDWCAHQQISVGLVMMPLRLFLVGAMKGPDVFQIMMVLGKEEVLKRLNIALGVFQN